jgi:UTP--glucose-1-phosphate uridylyltransferase
VLLPDELTIDSPSCTAQLVAAHGKTGGNVVAVMDVPRDQTKSYGIAAVKAGKDGLAEITGLVEKPNPEAAPSTLAIIGRYVLMPEVFDHLDKHETGAGGEIQLTDAMAKMIGSQPFHALTYAGQRYDCGTRLGFLEANCAVALNRDDTKADTRALLGRLLKG